MNRNVLWFGVLAGSLCIALSSCSRQNSLPLPDAASNDVPVDAETLAVTHASSGDALAQTVAEKQGWSLEDEKANMRVMSALENHRTPSDADWALISKEAPKYRAMVEGLISYLAASLDPKFQDAAKKWAIPLLNQKDDQYACLIGYQALKRVHSPEADIWRATLLQRDSGFFTKELDDIDRRVG